MKFRCYSRQLKTAGLVITTGAILAGCGGTDLSEQLAKDRLEQARTAYAQAKANPVVESYAMKSLLEAEKTLHEAEQAREKVYSPSPGDSRASDPTVRKVYLEDISRLAYLSERKSLSSVALAESVATRNELAALEKEKAEVELRKSELARKQLNKNLAEKTSALSQAASEAEHAKNLADIKAREAALARAQAEEAKAELAQLMKELSELQGQLTDRGIVLTIGDVLFATGKSALNPAARISMDKLGEFLKTKQNRNLLVEGHTDSVGGDEYNKGLSEQRAESVKAALIQRGIDAKRIVTIGYGKKYPIASNATTSGKQQNRRVEAIILNEGVKPESQFRK